MKPENCALFILAAGQSTRFGTQDKLMADLGGKPVLAHVIDTGEPIQFQAKYGIIPSSSVKRRALFGQREFSLIENDVPESGQGSSLILAAQTAIAQDYDAICILLADMPFVPTAHLETLIDTLYDKKTAISACNHTTMPPMAVRKSVFEALSKINPKGGAKALFKDGVTVYLPLSNRAAQDIDTPEDLAWLNTQIGA